MFESSFRFDLMSYQRSEVLYGLNITTAPITKTVMFRSAVHTPAMLRARFDGQWRVLIAEHRAKQKGP